MGVQLSCEAARRRNLLPRINLRPPATSDGGTPAVSALVPCTSVHNCQIGEVATVPTMALPIAGKIRQQLSRALLLRLAAAIARQLSAAGTRAGKLDDLPFDAHRIQVMKRLVSARMRHLQPG
jgi:hypothetical protein